MNANPTCLEMKQEIAKRILEELEFVKGIMEAQNLTIEEFVILYPDYRDVVMINRDWFKNQR